MLNLKAEYGALDRYIDVTERFKKITRSKHNIT